MALVLASVAVLGLVPPTFEARQVARGDFVEAKVDVDVTDTIPGGLLKSSTVVATMSRGDAAVVYEVKNVPTVVRTDQWLRVGYAGETGWVYNGSSETTRRFFVTRQAG
jgi:hypothetical protein